MNDNRRSSSSINPFFNEFQQIVSPDESNQTFSLINSAGASDTVDDAEIARVQQERLYTESLMDVDTPTFRYASSIDVDAAFAHELQQREYARKSILLYNQGSNYERSPPFIVESDNRLIVSDAELAAHLQAEENQKQRGNRSRPPFNSQRRASHSATTRPSASNEFEVIPIPPFARPTQDHNPSNGQNNNFSSLFRVLTSRGRSTHNHAGGRAARNLQNNTEDFGPDDYENLLELDNAVKNSPLTRDQINRLPTEKFHRTTNKSDEENKCSICWDYFEENQVLRRLTCLHLYHKDCIDSWLKNKNLCPICRIPPIE